jgi:hypothetical protein
MNERIRKIAEQAWDETAVSQEFGNPVPFAERLADLLIVEIYNQVKQELIDDELIEAEQDPIDRAYLKGCNGGTVDALYHIKNFGLEDSEE